MTFSEGLFQPYPLISFNEGVRRNIFFSLFLTLFLLIFRPFGLMVYSYEESYIIAGYGIVTFLTILMADYVSTHFLSRVFNEENWRVYKQLLYTLCVLFFLGITNYIYAYFIGAFPGTIPGFLKVQLYVLLSCIVPVLLVVMWRQNHLLKKNLQEAKELSADLPVKESDSDVVNKQVVSEVITFTGENKNDSVSVSADHLVCIVSKENYIEIVWQEASTIKKSLLRSTLTRAEDTLAGDHHFFRTHRSYLVNLNKVISVDGNAQGYRLTMEGMTETIPVARGRATALHETLNIFKPANPD